MKLSCFCILLVLVVFVFCQCGFQNASSSISPAFHPGISNPAYIAALDSSWTPEWAYISAVWHLDETSLGTAPGGGDAWDASGNSHNGTASGAIVLGVPAIINLGVTLNGANSYYTIANPATLPSGTHARSVCAWATTTNIGTPFSFVASWGTTAAAEAAQIGESGSTLVFGAYGGSSISVAGFWTLNTWHHICGTYDGANATLYADGVKLVGPTALAWNLVSGTAYVGQQIGGGSVWPGTIDEVAIWNTNLTATEVQTIYVHQTSH